MDSVLGELEGRVPTLTEAPHQKPHGDVIQKQNPGGYRKDTYLVISEHVLEGLGSLGDFSKNERAGRHHISPLLPRKDTWTPEGNSTAQHTLHLAC